LYLRFKNANTLRLELQFLKYKFTNVMQCQQREFRFQDVKLQLKYIKGIIIHSNIYEHKALKPSILH